jgi:Cu-processing system permease protein
MKLVNPKTIFTIAKKEFLDNIRNRWIIIMTVLFVILFLLFGIYAGTLTKNSFFGDVKATAMLLSGISSFIIPIIAIVLGFSTISGEAESGALFVVLSYPVKRSEVLIGKFLGLGSVLIFSILCGFGIGGIVIAATGGGGSIISYLLFIAFSIILGFIYLSLAIMASSFCKTRVKSILAGFLIFFYAMLVDTIFFVIYMSTGGTIDLTGQTPMNFPSWFYTAQVIFSPMDSNQYAASLSYNVRTIKMNQGTFTIPDHITTVSIFIINLIWIIIPLLLAYFFFKRRDI